MQTLRKICALTGLFLFNSACTNLERKVFVRRIDFEVDPKANKGVPFVCHIAIPYSSDLVQKLHGMDAKTYFTQFSELKRLYKDRLEIFSYDIIPGKSKLKEKVSPRSRVKAFGAYIFAKYTVNGKFAERLGLNEKILVKFEEYKMTIYDGTSKEPQFDDKCANPSPKKELPKEGKTATPEPECVVCPPGAEYMEECSDGSVKFIPDKSLPETNNEDCVQCPDDVDAVEECEDGTYRYIYSKNLKNNTSANNRTQIPNSQKTSAEDSKQVKKTPGKNNSKSQNKESKKSTNQSNIQSKNLSIKVKNKSSK